VATRATDPAVLIYTSGTTGPPKGALMPHSALIGNLPGFVASQNWFPRPGDVFWSPADWAWTGGLMDALLPTLYFGFPIVGMRGRFAPDRALDLMHRYRVTNAFLFPTALKMMMRAPEWRHAGGSIQLRAVMSAGEAVGTAVFDWTREHLGVTVNEMFGQTEINYIVGNAHEKWPARPGAMGRPYPGHRVAVIDDAGRELPAGEVGEVAVHRRDIHGDPDPVFFIGYLNNESATREKFTGDPRDSWCRTGDLATRDGDGYLWYRGRADDMFKAAGYRIGPGEIENCLLGHPSVANVAVVPKPDAERGAVVKAFVVLAQGVRGDGALVKRLQEHVRGKLAPYEYPKEIEFIDALPMTTTGKVQRRVLREMESRRAGTGG
jgi:acetyl-CoA synthetase